MAAQDQTAVPSPGTVRNRKLYITLAVALLLFGGIAYVLNADPTSTLVSTAPVTPDLRPPGGDVSPAEQWIAKGEKRLEEHHKQLEGFDVHLKTIDTDVGDLHRGQQEMVLAIDELKHLIQNQKQKQDATQGTYPPNQDFPRRPRAGAAIRSDDAVPPPGNGQSSLVMGAPTPPPAPAIMHVKLEPKAPSVPVGTVKAVRTVDNYLPSGTILPATLLAGLDAPTGGAAQSQPIPVLARINDDGFLPNLFRGDFRECFLVASGYGDLSSERAHLKTGRLSCIAHDGRILDMDVDAVAVGDDSKEGVRGRVVSKQGSLIAKALLAGIAAGFGEAAALTAQRIRSTVVGSIQEPKDLDAQTVGTLAVGLGVANAANQVAEFYLDLANKQFPIIEVDAARKIAFFVKKGTHLDFVDGGQS